MQLGGDDGQEGVDQFFDKLTVDLMKGGKGCPCGSGGGCACGLRKSPKSKSKSKPKRKSRRMSGGSLESYMDNFNAAAQSAQVQL